MYQESSFQRGMHSPQNRSPVRMRTEGHPPMVVEAVSWPPEYLAPQGPDCHPISTSVRDTVEQEVLSLPPLNHSTALLIRCPAEVVRER